MENRRYIRVLFRQNTPLSNISRPPGKKKPIPVLEWNILDRNLQYFG